MKNFKHQTAIHLFLVTLIAGLGSPKLIHADDLSDQLLDIAKKRQLSAEDILSAAQTFTPADKKDEFVCLNSGGQATSVIVTAVPSMRILKYIPTGAPDPSLAFSNDEQSKALMKQGNMETQKITWGDTHHPSFSETNGEYDGRFAFINDKANPRIFVIDLRDFETKQIVPNPIFMSSHGGAFVTPNTDYIMEGSQYAAPPDRKYYPLTQENFNKYYRGGVTFHKFDNKNGRIDTKRSFTVLAPPYSQDLSDVGKGESDGFTFTNSFCTERYIGTGPEKKNPAFEAGCSVRDMDYMHIINWKRAEELVKQGRSIKINGHATIPLEMAAKEGVLFLIPEAKSPHGADVSPDGRYIIVAGKLDTHASVYDFRKIKELIAKKDFADRDPYGVPILDLKKSLHGQVDVGIGPLHTQYGSEPGVVYTSLYLDSQVAKWDYLNLKVLDKVSVHYNIGHLVSMQGDSVDPRGRYVVALNKLAIDRFTQVGPLHPQNHQLIDTSGPKMRLIYDMPFPMGEPHYTVCIDANKIKPIDYYPAGTDPTMMKVSSLATKRGQERVVREGSRVQVFATVSKDGIKPLRLNAQQGDDITFHITNIEQEVDQAFKFSVHGYDALGVFPPGKMASVRFKATQAGNFTYKADAIASPFETRDFGTLTVKGSARYELARVQKLEKTREAEMKLAQLPEGAPSEVKRAMATGERQFEDYGCIACHQQGQDVTAPDLTGIMSRRDEKWLENWIVTPENYYEDKTIKAMIEKYQIPMPNQGVTNEDAREIIKYLKTWSPKNESTKPKDGSSSLQTEPKDIMSQRNP